MKLNCIAFLLVAAPLTFAVSAHAQTAEVPQKFSVLVTHGDEPCPVAEGDEIIVCAQRPESDRYRVPKELRGQDKEASAGGQSWASAVAGYDDVARVGRPNSCSPVGSNGFTGCQAAALRQWFAERNLR